MSWKLAIFDLDGTILDTLEDLSDSTNAALKAFGYPERSLSQVRSFVGNGIRRLIHLALPEGVDPRTEEAVLEYFKAHYKEHCADKTKPYDGIQELVMGLRADGIRTAVVSNKADFAVQELVKQYFPGLFDSTAGEKEGIRRKPAPDVVFSCLDLLETAAEDAVYIGDSEVDIQTAQAAGMDSLIVTWGFRDEAFLKEKGARVILHSMAELEEKLRGKKR